MTMHQLTLFDVAPGAVESPPLVRVPDEVYEVRATMQIHGRTGVMRCSMQVKSAVTDELFSWRMDESPGSENLRRAWVASKAARFITTVEDWYAPF